MVQVANVTIWLLLALALQVAAVRDDPYPADRNGSLGEAVGVAGVPLRWIARSSEILVVGEEEWEESSIHDSSTEEEDSDYPDDSRGNPKVEDKPVASASDVEAFKAMFQGAAVFKSSNMSRIV